MRKNVLNVFFGLGIALMIGMPSGAFGQYQLICGCGLIGRWQPSCTFVICETNNRMVLPYEIQNSGIHEQFGLPDVLGFHMTDGLFLEFNPNTTAYSVYKCREASVSCSTITTGICDSDLVPLEWQYRDLNNGELLLTRTFTYNGQIHGFPDNATFRVFAKYVKKN